jgi:hypothetical protein
MAVILMKVYNEIGLLRAPRKPSILDFFKRVYSFVMSWFPTSSADRSSIFSLISFSMNLTLS